MLQIIIWKYEYSQSSHIHHQVTQIVFMAATRLVAHLATAIGTRATTLLTNQSDGFPGSLGKSCVRGRLLDCV